MAKAMKVHLYDVVCTPESTRLECILQATKDLPVAKREIKVGETPLRLETAKLDAKLWLLDFAGARYDHGPGKVARDTAITDFDLGEDEGFGEETAALYDPQAKRLYVQYNHYGPRAQTIAKYLSLVAPTLNTAVSLHAKLDTTAEIRLAKAKAIRRITAKVASVVATDKFKDAGVSVRRAAELARSIGGETVTITISASRGGRLSAGARTLLGTLQKLVPKPDDQAPSPIETLKAVTIPSNEAPADEIDLLMPRLSTEVGNLVPGPGLRYTQQSRWDALRSAHTQWRTLP